MAPTAWGRTRCLSCWCLGLERAVPPRITQRATKVDRGLRLSAVRAQARTEALRLER